MCLGHLEDCGLSNLCSILTWPVYIVFIKPAEKSSFREETTEYFRVEQARCPVKNFVYIKLMKLPKVGDSFLLMVL